MNGVSSLVKSESLNYTKYTNTNGSEVILNNKTNQLVVDPINRGTANQFKGFSHTLDVLMWVAWGTCQDDPSSPSQRLGAMLLVPTGLTVNATSTDIISP